jgi:hypothetical protein
MELRLVRLWCGSIPQQGQNHFVRVDGGVEDKWLIAGTTRGYVGIVDLPFGTFFGNPDNAIVL